MTLLRPWGRSMPMAEARASMTVLATNPALKRPRLLRALPMTMPALTFCMDRHLRASQVLRWRGSITERISSIFTSQSGKPWPKSTMGGTTSCILSQRSKFSLVIFLVCLPVSTAILSRVLCTDETRSRESTTERFCEASSFSRTGAFMPLSCRTTLRSIISRTRTMMAPTSTPSVRRSTSAGLETLRSFAQKVRNRSTTSPCPADTAWSRAV
mmetsp:Transcript_49738/g.158844  ORF Transcript_49738/g.158844 Transcript_49738/m.158844 type:complete len:213 (-) Transcript_49738:2976-3614(-)